MLVLSFRLTSATTEREEKIELRNKNHSQTMWMKKKRCQICLNKRRGMLFSAFVLNLAITERKKNRMKK